MTTQTQNHDRRIGRWIFLLILGVNVLCAAGRIEQSDGVVIFEVTESLVERASLHIDRDLSYYETKPGWSYFDSGLSVAAAPFYALGKLASLPFAKAARWPIVMLFGAFTNAVVNALLGALFFAFARQLGAGKGAALAATLCLAFATTLFPYSQKLVREPLSGLALLTSVYLLFWRARGGPRRLLLGSGLAFAVMTWTRFEAWALLPFLLGYLLADREAWDWRAAATDGGCFLAAPVLFLPVFLYFNFLKFGSPFSLGFSGHSMTATPLWIGLSGLLFSRMYGVAASSPIVLVALFGLPRLAKERRALAIAVGAMLAFGAVFYSKYAIWTGHLSEGPRFLVTFFPLALLPLALLLDAKLLRGWSAATIAAAAVAGLARQLLAVAANADVIYAQWDRLMGAQREFFSSMAFLQSPAEAYWEAIRSGAIDLIWLRLGAAGVPRIFVSIPALAVVGVGLACRRLWLDSEGGGAWRAAWAAAPRAARVRTLLLLGIAGAALLALGVGEAAAPRGLRRTLAAQDQDQLRALRREIVRQPLVDRSADPFTGPGQAVVWEGFWRAPSYYYFTHLFVSASGRFSVRVDDQVVFANSADVGETTATQQRVFKLSRGFHPVQIVYEPTAKTPLFELRWTIQDYALRSPIGAEFWFTEKPGPLLSAFLESEFYLKAAALVAAFLALATALEAMLAEIRARGTPAARLVDAVAGLVKTLAGD